MEIICFGVITLLALISSVMRALVIVKNMKTYVTRHDISRGDSSLFSNKTKAIAGIDATMLSREVFATLVKSGICFNKHIQRTG